MNKLDLIFMMIAAVLGGINYYLKTRNNVTGKASELIVKAEQVYLTVNKSGILKKEYVVNQLYTYIPAIFQKIITKDVLSTIVQNLFDSMETYTKLGIDKTAASAEQKTDDSSQD